MVEYIVYIEDTQSITHWYSNTYSTNLSIAGSESVELTLPVTLTLNATEGATLVSALSDGYADYIIEGTFHAIDVSGVVSDFFLPLYDEGTVPATIVGP